MKRPALDLIDQIGRIQVRPFLVPVPDADSVMVTTVQEGVRFNYQLKDREPGWWVLHCDQVTVRQVEEPNNMFDTVQYLANLPRYLAIAVHRLGAETWLVVPWNSSDASQRGWRDGEPKAMHLVRDSIRPFDVVVARRLDRTLLYDALDEGLGVAPASDAIRESFGVAGQDPRASGVTPEMRAAASILENHGAAVSRASKERAAADHRTSLEGRLQWHLAFVGAELLGWHEAGEGYEVRWRHDGHEFHTRLRRDFQVQSAGICLDDTDQRHNLSSIVAVMKEGRRMGMEDEWDG